MSASPALPPRSGTVSPAEADGYLLLTIQHAQVKQLYDGQAMTLARGELRIECVTLPIPPEIGHQTANPFSPSPSDPAVPTHDFWLVLRVGPTFEMPLIPGQELQPTLDPTPEGIVYTVPSPNVPNASLQVILPIPGSTADMEDLDSLEVLLRQYKSLGVEATALQNVTVPPIGGSPEPIAEDMRGKLLLINEDNGEVIGELDQRLDVEDEKYLAGDDKNRPVILDFGNVVEGYAPQVKIQRVPQDEMDDWLLRGAHNVSKGILTFGSWSSRMMQSGAEKYIKSATPREEPVKFSPTTKANIRRAHNASVKTVNVTKTTVGMINNAIMKVADVTFDKAVAPAISAYDNLNPESRRNSQSAASSPVTGSRRPPPPVPIKPIGLGAGTAPPPLPARTPSPLKRGADSSNEKVYLPNESEMLLAEMDGADREHPPAYTDHVVSEPGRMQGPAPAGSSSASQKAKRPWLNRIVLAGEVVLTSLEATAHDLINSGTVAASSAAGHKYGSEAGQATALLGGSVRNVAVIYTDVRGVGRRALLKSTAKGFVKARLRDGQEVQLQGEGREGDAGVEVDSGEVEKGQHGEIVIGMTEVGRRNGQRTPQSGFGVTGQKVKTS